MFTLRVIDNEKIERNHVLGTTYVVINREINYEKFAETFKEVFNKPHVADLDETSDIDTKGCYAFITGTENLVARSLYKGNSNYIMTDTGKTFSNETYR